MEIIITQTANATPNRAWDYMATLKDYEGGDPIGLGATPGLAKEDLMECLSCDICGDYHEVDNIPFGCQTEDGE